MSELHSLVNGCIRETIKELKNLENENVYGDVDTYDDNLKKLRDKLASLRTVRDIVERLL